MSNNTKYCPAILLYPVAQNVCLEIFSEFVQLYCLLQDMDNVQNAVYPPYPAIRLVIRPVVCPVICPMSNNTKYPCPAILLYPVAQNVCLEIFSEFVQLYYLLQDMDNVQNAVSLSRQCIQFTPVKVHSNTSNIVFQDTITLLIASDYKVHLWSDVHSLYMFTEESRVTRSSGEVLEPMGFPPDL